METGKHFVLVHGVSNGAWSWYKLVTLLKSAGHRVTALDLGACGINLKHLKDIVSIFDYMQPLMQFLANLPQDEKIILVGHSFGGFSISLAMENFPEKILVAAYVTAFMPNHTSPPATLLEEMNSKKAPKFGPDFLATRIYQNCSAEDLELARLLVRPTKYFIEDLANNSLLSESKFGSVNRVYVVCDEDMFIKEDFQRWMIGNNPPKEVKLVNGADHMVMFSKPKELFQCLQEIAEKYN
ncbi:Salicylic acid-binding protein 2 [Quillaja saponaria]|uniref:Salicylic acid-binding protein 2 n=1 Tax=Quillaja saponaria TaxID=32244 RepID=A0AAD7L8W3_QUISA|nr:Salicylic acid-binding protein 2 [Quillaja saponaria]